MNNPKQRESRPEDEDTFLYERSSFQSYTDDFSHLSKKINITIEKLFYAEIL